LAGKMPQVVEKLRKKIKHKLSVHGLGISESTAQKTLNRLLEVPFTN